MNQTNTFKIYNASAGSGKTFTLVKEYLLLLLSDQRTDNYKNILAVTFTNKAVAEMKKRIVENLAAFSDKDCPRKFRPMKQMLEEELGLSSEEMRQKANGILKSIIHNYASFEVSTIDGFTHRVLRTFARDLDLPMNFEVELNTTEVLEQAVDQLIAKAGKDKELTEVLVRFVISKTDDDKSWDVSRDLLKIAGLLTQETNQPFLNLLKDRSLQDFELLGTNLRREVNRLETLARSSSIAFFALLEDNAIEHTSFSGGFCPKFFEKTLASDWPGDFDRQWQIKLEADPLYPKKIPDSQKVILDELQPEIWRLYNQVKSALLELQFLESVQKNLVPLSLLSAIQSEIEAIKRDRNIILISEFNAKIAASIQNQPAPFIYERLGERYKHYFIDEFQDTSELQWQNLIPLIDHALVTETDGLGGSLTLVGDAKQSIYRWRGGKAEQFMALCAATNPFSLDRKQVIQLPQNFRSKKEVVVFNNTFFSFSAQVFSNPKHQELFRNTSIQDPVSKDGGYVNLSFIEAENVEEQNIVYPERVLNIIRDLDARGIPKGDVCILTRTLKEGVLVANHLSQNGISVISQESLLVGRSAEVQFVTAILEFALDAGEKQLKLQILQYLTDHKLEVEDRHQFIVNRLDLDDQEFMDSLLEFGINLNLHSISETTLYEAVETIIREFNLIESSDAYLQFLLDFIYETSQGEQTGIFSFLEIWQRKKEKLSIIAPQSEDAVEIMTIHKAKGLEFQVVIYPFAHSKIGDVSRESLWMPLPDNLSEHIPMGYLSANKRMQTWDQLPANLYNNLCSESQLDALNVLYVALTRPVQELYIISKLDSNRKSQADSSSYSGLFIQYLQDKGIWDDKTEYEFGSKTQYELETREVTKVCEPQQFISSPTERSGISIITRSGLLWDSKQEKAIERGHLVHDLFSGIDIDQDVDRVVSEAREDGLFKYDEETEIRNILLEVVNHAALKEFYSGKTKNYNERNIISREGKILRPDRLSFNGNQVSLIDYKTGFTRTEHVNQINQYAQLLEEMGFEIKDRLLVYLNETVHIHRV